MAENIRLEIVTPEKEVVNEMVQIVMAPGSLGEFGVLTGHTPFMTSLNTGGIHYRDESGKDQYVFVSGGFAARAEKRLTEDRAKEELDIDRAKAALERAVIRIKIAASGS
jgi:F-type H+-transporting ATPase subunit epsilon